MEVTTLILIGIAIVIFIRPLTILATTVEKMVTINAYEEQVNFEFRANVVAEKLNELGPVRVEDLPELFKKHNISSVPSGKGITPKVGNNTKGKKP